MSREADIMAAAEAFAREFNHEPATYDELVARPRDVCTGYTYRSREYEAARRLVQMIRERKL